MENKVYGGTSFCTLLLVAFIVLKLCNVISWSWWWVMAPLWIPVLLVVALYVVGLVIASR